MPKSYFYLLIKRLAGLLLVLDLGHVLYALHLHAEVAQERSVWYQGLKHSKYKLFPFFLNSRNIDN